jgi:hypothetical protein
LSSLDCLKTPKSDTEHRNYSSFLPGLNWNSETKFGDKNSKL